MLFNSLHFLYFFVTVFFLYFKVVPSRYKWLLLLAASCYFYAVYIPKFILILFFLITVDYVSGILIEENEGRRRKLFLIVSILSNLGILFFFKYFNFFSENALAIAKLIHWNYSPIFLQFALPLGLSFHVFQSLSYVVEVYKGRYKAERHFGIYALYVMFFPQLVAGPIERPQHLLPQLHLDHEFSPLRVRRGLELMLWGFFKKLVIADQIAQIVNYGYLHSFESSGVTLLVVAILFSYQLYCDFSGYSDIAIGTALVFGFDLTANFDRPYASTSIPEFWRRWHMSLSNWLRDYLYYPLAFSRKRVTKWWLYMSLVITFSLIGLWHGARFTYVVFGLMHGVLSVFSLWYEEIKKHLSKVYAFTTSSFGTGLSIIWTFLLVTASFIFFRSENLPQAFSIFTKIGEAILSPIESLHMAGEAISFANIHVTYGRLAVIIATIIFLEIIQLVQARKNTVFILDGRSKTLRWGSYYLLTFSILFLGYLEAHSFIYFQF